MNIWIWGTAKFRCTEYHKKTQKISENVHSSFVIIAFNSADRLLVINSVAKKGILSKKWDCSCHAYLCEIIRRKIFIDRKNRCIYRVVTKENDFMATQTTLYHYIDLIFHKLGKTSSYQWIF